MRTVLQSTFANFHNLPELREHGRGLYGVLPKEARAFTDKFANVDCEAVGVQADLTTELPNWKLDITNHMLAQELIGVYTRLCVKK